MDEYGFKLKVVDLASGELKTLTGDAHEVSMAFMEMLNKVQESGRAAKGAAKGVNDLGNAAGGAEKKFKAAAGSIDDLNNRIKRAEGIRNMFPPEQLDRIKKANEYLDSLRKKIDELKGKKIDIGVNTGGAGGGKKPPFGGFNGGEAAYGAADALSGGISPYMLPHMLRSGAFAGGVIGTAALAYSAKQALSFDEAMGNLNTTAGLDAQGRMKLGNYIVSMANQYGAKATDAANAFEQVLSGTNDLEGTKRLFPTLLQARRAMPRASTQELADMLTYMKNVSPSSSDRDNLDLMVSAKQQGKGEAGDFARYLPELISQGKSNGFGKDDITATFSYLTRTFSAATSSMLTQNLTSALNKPDTWKALDRILPGGVYNADRSKKQVGQILGQVAPIWNNGTDEQRDLLKQTLELRDMQASTAFGALVGNVKDFNKVLEGIKNREGAADKAAKDGASAQTKLEEATNKLSNSFTSAGTGLIPVINTFTNALNNLAFISNLIAEIGGGFDSKNLGKYIQEKLALNGMATDGMLEAINESYNPSKPKIVNDPLQSQFYQGLNKSDSTAVPNYNGTGLGAQLNGSSSTTNFEATRGGGGMGAAGGGITIHIDRVNGIEHYHGGGVADAVGKSSLEAIVKTLRQAEGLTHVGGAGNR